MSSRDDPPWLIRRRGKLWSLACSVSACWRLLGNPADPCGHWCTTLCCAYCIIIHMRWLSALFNYCAPHASLAHICRTWFERAQTCKGCRDLFFFLCFFFFIKNSHVTRAIIRAYIIWCDPLRQLVLLPGVTAVCACLISSRTKESQLPGRGKRCSKSISAIFRLFILHLRHHRHYLCVLVCSSALHSAGLCFAFRLCAFVWSAFISGGHIGCPGGTGNGQCANCVGNLREPYAVC